MDKNQVANDSYAGNEESIVNVMYAGFYVESEYQEAVTVGRVRRKMEKLRDIL